MTKLLVGVKNDFIGQEYNTVKYNCPVLFDLLPLLNL